MDKLLQTIPAEGQVALESFKPFIDASNSARPVNSQFDNAWSESHVDHYHTEEYDCGDEEHPATCTRQVYDYTTHSYYYHPNHGEAASKMLEDLLVKFNGLSFTEELRKPSQTNAEGEYAAEKTNKPKVKGRRMSPFEFMFYSTLWDRGFYVEIKSSSNNE